MQPFPWEALPKVAKADVEATRAARRWGAHVARIDAAAEALGGLVGARVGVSVTRVRAVARPSGTEGALAVLVATADAAEPGRATLVEVEGALAGALVARAIRRPTPAVPDLGHAPGPPVAGALAAVLVATARKVHGDRALRVLAAGPAPALARDVAVGMIEATMTVTVDGAAYAARVAVPRAAALAAPPEAWTAEALAAMGDVPLAVPIVAAATRSTAAEVGSWRRGDAWLPGEWGLRMTAAGELVGPVLLSPPGSERALRADLGEEGRLVVRGGVESLAWTPREDDVSEEKDALVDAVGEVPVVVRVEVGVAELRAREWAALGRGDVIALGKKLGEPVLLRVGGIAVARGELVDLEGEIGVRILGRLEER
jgi:flagellar motor switch/type III secretory pathway protein FliN